MSRRAQAAVSLAGTLVVVLAAGAIAVASMRHYYQSAAAQVVDAPPSLHVPKVVQASLPVTPASYLGVYEGSSLATDQYNLVERFATVAGRQPNIVMYYSSWGEGFSVSYARTAYAHGATLLIDIDPTGTTAASIAAGQQDAFLQSYALSVKVFGHPVIISFGHEMNGNWYPWGYTHTRPAEFVAAWRHIVDVFRQAGADNVTWLWTVNAVGQNEGPIANWWPGGNYVTWAGFDAYYYNSYDNFSGVFGPTIAAIRQLTHKPIMIGETAIGQVAGQAAKIPGLFAGIADRGLLGFVWFDQAQNAGLYHQDWRLEGHPYAVAAFRASVARYFTRPATTPAPGAASSSG